MPGLTGILERIAALWHERQDEIGRSADEIAALARTISVPASRDPDSLLPDAGFREFSRQFDPENGGFGNAPKFPAPHIVIFLLRYWHGTGEPRALAMAKKTLDAIRQGGIWDHVGGGLHRYATDARWRIPHFEKMLYDQALFVLACTEAYQATRNDRYRTMADECIEYVLRDLRDPGGGFYSAEDADSPGGEGAFYSWTNDELSTTLGPDDAAFATSVFTLTPLPALVHDRRDSGAHKSGQRFILSAAGPDTVLAKALFITSDEIIARREAIRSRLFAARKERPRPARDDKILTDTNALFCTALARAGRAFKNPAYTGAAEEAVQFILDHLSDKYHNLLHRYRDGESAIPAFADDYAYLVAALIALYETTFDPAYLSRALALNATFVARFQDKENGGFFTTSDRAEELLVRKKEWYDGAVPSANAIAFENLTWLARVTEDKNLEEAAVACSRFLAGAAERAPTATAAFLAGLTCLPPLGDTQDLVIAGDPSQPDTRALLDAACDQYLPGLIVLHRPLGKAGDDLETIVPIVHGRTAINGHAAAFPCTGHTCRAPVHDPVELARMLGDQKTDK
jgi:uncharacterized protein YyaL (SSP411 family)